MGCLLRSSQLSTSDYFHYKQECSQSATRKADLSLESQFDKIQLTMLKMEALLLAGWTAALITPWQLLNKNDPEQCYTQLDGEEGTRLAWDPKSCFWHCRKDEEKA